MERCKPLFDGIGSHTFHMGDIGMGQVGKIVNNHIALITEQAVREGLRVARASGIDERRMLEVAHSSSADSFAVRNWEAMQQQVAAYPSGPAGLANLAYKDLQLALLVGHDVEVRLPLAAITAQILSYEPDAPKRLD
jgi:3-hydroxyisobutyrate dehydrogenase-like beta-hydroxyacid dehydrogenase